MAKSKGPADKTPKVSYPSQFGSHASMIDEEATKNLDNPSRVVLKDEHGLYETDRYRLDSKLADPNRYKTDRLGKLFGRKDKEKGE